MRARQVVRGVKARRPWPLRIRVLALLIVVALLLVGAVVAITINTLMARDAVLYQVEDLGPAQVRTESLQIQFLTETTGIEGYARTGDDDYLDSYYEGRSWATAALADLETNVADEPHLSELVAEVRRSSARWHADYAQVVIEHVDRFGAGTVSPAIDARGRFLFDDLRGAIAELRLALNDAERHATTTVGNTIQTLITLLVGVGIGIVVLSLLIWVQAQRWILHPVELLSRQTRQVAGGDFGHTIIVTGPVETIQLGRDVDAMRERIVSELEAVATARRQLQEQSKKLAEQAEELRRSNEELEQFAYVASHDLQEPLRKIASFCQLLQRRYEGRLDERADSYIAFAVEGAKRMQKLINDLLAFSRVGRTKNFVDVELDAVVRGAVRSLETAIEEAGAEITATGLPRVHGDPGLLTQLLFNLIGNAVKFRGEEPLRVRVTARRSGDEWLLTCEDNGIGIEPEYAERIFVVFQRLHTRERYEGTGIGLALCKKIVEFHGGRIWLAEPPEGGGTRISWTLPAATGPGDPAVTAARGRALGSADAAEQADPAGPAGKARGPDDEADIPRE
ncbi:sensor histidine kinase [Allonocardiopsis opalescens]|uniref:sensor histidine kinase n=1 Tax=Allonocardiopsis opalescens TaxID=1144618 RepID=UPI001475CAF1|nr:ATP-binding protein [Allonocardiopsis opalescens]